MDASLRLKSPPPGSGTPPGRGVPESLLSPVLVKATPPVTFTGASATAIPPDAEGSNCSRPTTTGFKSFPGHPKTLQGSREAGDQMRARFQVDRFRSILNLKPIRPWCRVDPLWLRRLRQPKGQCALLLMMRGTTTFTLKPVALVLKADDVNPAQVSPPAGGEPGETATPPASGASSAWGGSLRAGPCALRTTPSIKGPPNSPHMAGGNTMISSEASSPSQVDPNDCHRNMTDLVPKIWSRSAAIRDNLCESRTRVFFVSRQGAIPTLTLSRLAAHQLSRLLRGPCMGLLSGRPGVEKWDG